VGANDKAAATYHPTEYRCTECQWPYATKSAADTCAEQDELEDRATRRITRSSN